MVYGQIARIAAQGVRAAGIHILPRAVKTFTKYDKKIFRSLYGQSGGRGVRHGRDIGAAVGGLMASQGKDELDGKTFQPQYLSRAKSKAYRRRSKFGYSGSSNYNTGYRDGLRACAIGTYSGKRRKYR